MIFSTPLVPNRSTAGIPIKPHAEREEYKTAARPPLFPFPSRPVPWYPYS